MTTELATVEKSTGILLSPDPAKGAGIHFNTPNSTYGSMVTIGDAPGSIGFAGTGSPAIGWGALTVYQKYGEEAPNADVLGTTQAMYVLANYYGKTVTDSMEGFSSFVAAKDTGTPYTQSLAVTAVEGIAQIEGGNIHDGGATYPVSGVGSRVNVLGTSTVDTAAGFKATVNTSGGPTFGTITNYYGFWQPTASPATNSYGVYTVDPIVSRTGLKIDEDGGSGEVNFDTRTAKQSGTAFGYIKGADGQTTVTTLRIDGVASQTARMLACRVHGGTFDVFGVSSLGLMHSTAGIAIQSSAGARRAGLDNNGAFYTAAVSAPADASIQTSEVSVWFDPTPGAAKVMFKGKNSSGTVVTGSVALS